MRAIIVCVDYWDYLKVTLPYNRHHFQDVMVVTCTRDTKTQQIAKENNCWVYVTDSFYDDGANFNKWKALEEALDVYKRTGWLCIMDADVLWPKTVVLRPVLGNLYTPFRRMLGKFNGQIPPENTWTQFVRHRNVGEFAGYSQIFHARDPHLPSPPWHETNWRHAGGADSFFQKLWPVQKRIRPNWECLHLGPAGTNWCGRTTPFLDGSTPEAAVEKRNALAGYMRGRRTHRNFDHEKL